jgi:phosphate transport system substrate-binding protein
VKALDVDAGDGCTPPSLEGASTGEYPLSRPIFWYVNGNRLTENPALEPFIRFAIEMTGDQSIVADDIGYVPMNDEEIQNNLSKIDDAVSE